MKKVKVSKEFLYLLALAMDGCGGAFVIYSLFGVTAMSALPLVLNDVFPGLTVGTMSFILQGLVLLITLLVLKKFSFYYLSCFLSAFLYGGFLDLFIFVLKPLPTLLGFRILYFILNAILVGAAIGFYMRCDMPLMPFDIIVKEFAIATKKKEGVIKIFVDLAFFFSSVIISLIAFKEIRYVGVATFILAVSIGFITDLSNSFFDKIFEYKVTTTFGKLLESLTISNEHSKIKKNED